MANGIKKKGGISERKKNWLWLALSLAAALAVWTVLSVLPSTSRSFPNVIVVFQQIPVMIERNVLFKDISSSLISVGLGYLLGFVIALPVAILMAWYNPFRRIIEPWIQKDHRTLDTVHKEHPSPCLRTAYRHCSRCGTQTSGHRHHYRHLPDNVHHHLPGNHKH